MEISEFVKTFSQTLLEEIPKYLAKHASKFTEEEIRVFDIGCFPWHGYLELSFLTTNEDDFEKEYGKYAIADWRLYAFNYNIVGEVESFDHLSTQMKDIWEETDSKGEFTEALLIACANVANTAKEVIINNYNVTKDFETTVFHPDDPDKENYCTKNS